MMQGCADITIVNCSSADEYATGMWRRLRDCRQFQRIAHTTKEHAAPCMQSSTQGYKRGCTAWLIGGWGGGGSRGRKQQEPVFERAKGKKTG